MNLKRNICTLLLGIGISAAGYAEGKDSLGLPGDNLDLYSVLELFKNSENPEAFEAALNKEDSKVNNLDLNGDGEIDYIRVVDHVENDAHALVLQVPVNETESQDVAVIELEKNDNETANIQIVGDEDIYGKDYIIEPMQQEAATAKLVNSTVVVNVWAWPSVRYIYGPRYVVWVSPWKWRHYPGWWKPWKPFGWHIYRGWGNPYRVHHHRVLVHRVVRAHAVYHSHRVVSKTVHQRRVSAAKPARGVKQGRRVEKQHAARGARAAKQTNGQHRGPRR